MKETKLVVTENYEMEYGEESKFLANFVSSDN